MEPGPFASGQNRRAVARKTRAIGRELLRTVMTLLLEAGVPHCPLFRSTRIGGRVTYWHIASMCRTNVPSIISPTCLRISNQEVPLRLQSRIVQFRLNRYWVSRRSISSVRRPPDRARKRAISRSVCLCRDSTIARTIRLSRPGLWSPFATGGGVAGEVSEETRVVDHCNPLC